MTKKRIQGRNMTLKIEGDLDSALRAVTPPPIVFEWKVGHLVVVDQGKEIETIGEITSIIDDIFVMVQTKDKEYLMVNRNRLKKK